MPSDSRPTAIGTLYALLSYILWGLLPVYWRWLAGVPAVQQLAHRVFWATAILGVLVASYQRRKLRAGLANPRAILGAVLAGLLLGTNWSIYIWAISVERLVEASLGYYINPLINVLLGVVFLRERLGRLQLVALLLATVGVAVLTISGGTFPWISLVLATSFGTYGLIKKTGSLSNLVSLFVELWLIGPLAGVYILIIGFSGNGSFLAEGPLITVLLIGTGVITIAPLLLFGAAARRISLSSLGFLQYLAPTLMLILGTVFWGEPFGITRAISFSLIWIALALYTFTLIRGRNARRREERSHVIHE